MTFVLTWCANIFVVCSVTPLFSADHLILSIILKNKKNLYMGHFDYFSYTIQIGLEVFTFVTEHTTKIEVFTFVTGHTTKLFAHQVNTTKKSVHGTF